MSELKATTVYDAYWKANSVGEGKGTHVYLKSEADKVIADLEKKLDIYKRGWMENDRVNANQYAEIRHHKYKRCLAMAQICYKNSVACANYTMPHEKYKHWRRWQTIWSEFAKRFKTNSTAQQGKEEAK